MSGIPSITASGLGLLDAAEQRLARSAHTFTRSGAPDDPAAGSSASAPDDVVDAAVGVIYGRSEFRIGVSLIAVGRDTEKSLLDILA
ncbi:MAG: hypothetical protein ABIR79_08680 [Candidatus Binatia bacterium]